jgi:mRNA-degrading endonuclease YafQ of YafQ-DinJ toxin-antitoxin module
MKRPVRAIYYTSHFERQYRRLSETQKLLAEKKEALFRADALDPRLRTHQLKGRLGGRWAFSIGPDLRIVFRFVDGHEALFLALGPHGTVY